MPFRRSPLLSVDRARLEGPIDDVTPSPGRPTRNLDGDLLVPKKESPTAFHSQSADPGPPGPAPAACFEPPVSALGPLFRYRLEQIHVCQVSLRVQINSRPTRRVLGGYYKSRRLVRVYSHDRVDGRRPLEELFHTFLHEVAHHLEYTEPQNFGARTCRRVYGLMHSRLFWRILGELKWRWAELEARPRQ